MRGILHRATAERNQCKLDAHGATLSLVRRGARSDARRVDEHGIFPCGCTRERCSRRPRRSLEPERHAPRALLPHGADVVAQCHGPVCLAARCTSSCSRLRNRRPAAAHVLGSRGSLPPGGAPCAGELCWHRDWRWGRRGAALCRPNFALRLAPPLPRHRPRLFGRCAGHCGRGDRARPQVSR